MTNGDTLLLARSSGTPYLSYALVAGAHIVGRSTRCDFVVRDLSVSRQHAKVIVDDHGVSVQDLESRNGTFINEARVTMATLLPGQQVRFGSVPFLLTPGSDAGAENIDSAMQTAPVKPASSPGRDVPEELSTAQRRVLDLLMDGLSEKEIAVRLRLSPHTIHNHVRAIYRAFEVHSRPELLVRVMRNREGPVG